MEPAAASSSHHFHQHRSQYHYGQQMPAPQQQLGYYHAKQRTELQESTTPPVRDATTLKGIKYGPGHEKFPSWPSPAAAEAPAATRSAPTGGSHRSKSWTDQTSYPKEPVVAYTRPFMKRPNASYPQQLKTVLENFDKIIPDTFKSRLVANKMSDERHYLLKPEQESVPADRDYALSSQPERDLRPTPGLETKYSRTYQAKTVIQHDVTSKTQYWKSYPSSGVGKEQKKLTQAELEEYTRSYEDALIVQHQKQSSYAQSEGYHSYVSSADSTSTPFLDRLRRDVDASGLVGWEARGDRDSVVTTSSASSSETLKWHGSLSDISVASSSFSSTSKQLIAHSAKVKTPQRHSSESVLYIDNGMPNADRLDSDIEHREIPAGVTCQQHLKLFPISTYSVPETNDQSVTKDRHSSTRLSNSCSPPQMSVAERVSELERQNSHRYNYQESKKQTRISDPALKAKQKKALLSFYERHQQKDSKTSWRSEPQLSPAPQQPTQTLAVPQVRPQQPASRRASSASDYASWRDIERDPEHRDGSRSPDDDHVQLRQSQRENEVRFSPNSILEGPVILGPVISLDDWVPERPPKNSKLLRNVYPDLYNQDERLPSPDLPLPSPPTVLEDEVFNNDEPFPPPPIEVTDDWKCHQEVAERLPNESKVRYSFENLGIQKPTPIRSNQSKNPAGAMSQLVPSVPTSCAVSSEPAQCSNNNIRPSDLPLITAASLPFKQNVLKRVYPNNHENKIVRNSFRVPQDNSVHAASSAADIRSSMRHFRNNVPFNTKQQMISIQKPVVSAQKQLFRSTTVDETNISPKKPINPFLRSTSLRQVEPENKLAHNISASFTSHKQMCERASMRYNQKKPVNGMFHEIIDGQKMNETTGHFRPEFDKQNKSVVSKIEMLYQTSNLHDVSKHNPVKQESVPYGSLNNASAGLPSIKNPPLDPKHGVLNKIPPPLFPKQVPKPAANSVMKKLNPVDALQSAERGQDVVCYAPSRATHPEPAAGSYKLIQHKDEQLVARVLPDLLPDTARQLPYGGTSQPPSPQLAAPQQPPRPQSPVRPKPVDKIEPPPIPIDPMPEPKVFTETTIAIEQSTSLTNAANVKEEVAADAEFTEADTEVRLEAPAAEPTAEERAPPPRPIAARATLPAEIQCRLACTSFARRLPHASKLHPLVSQNEDYKNPTDFIKDLFKVDVSDGDDEESASSTTRRKDSLLDGDKTSQALVRPSRGTDVSEAASTTSNECDRANSIEEDKTKLIECLERVVEALSDQDSGIQSATRSNEEAGAALLDKLTGQLRAKLETHSSEVGHIASLMVGLSARLARTHNALWACRHDVKQIEMLHAKQSKLSKQLEEARSLKENIDRRAATLSAALAAQLDAADVARYKRYIATKAKLIIDARDVQDRLDVERQRARALRESSLSSAR